MNRIWGFGTAAVDFRIKTAEYGESYKEKLLAQETKWMGGGSTSNFLVQVKRLGGEAGWLGKLGTDSVGKTIMAMLTSESIDCSAVIQDERATSPFNIAVYAGDTMRRIGGFLLPNCMSEITSGDISSMIEKIDNNDWVLIEVGEIPLKTCIEMAGQAKKKGAKIVIDVDLDPIKQCGETRDVIDTLFGLCDLLIPNANAVSSLYPDTAIEQILVKMKEQYRCDVIASFGAQGAGYIDENNELKIINAIAANVVDTVGAGDAFHGGVIFGFSRKLNFERAILLGNICGAHNCKTFGARDGMIYADQLKTYGFEDIDEINI